MDDEGVTARLSNLEVESELFVWINVAQLENLECTKIKHSFRHKAFALRMLACSPIIVCRRVKD